MIVDVLRVITFLISTVLLSACAPPEPDVLDGRPGGPYRLTLNMEPSTPVVGGETVLEFQLTYTKSGKPVRDLQIAHERLIHNFIVNLDFSSFAHIHHEDFEPISDTDREQARLRFPYRFPTAGRYRIVSEFAHRNRSWTKHFDLVVGEPKSTGVVPSELALIDESDDYRASLEIGPPRLVAGLETALQLRLDHNGKPVNDLALYLGSEMHGAVWRDDGKFFGHLHSYTPKVAAILELAHDEGGDPVMRGARIQQMMVQLMCLESELVFSGPVIPIKYVFPEPGRYRVFLQVAPGGEPRVFHFVLNVESGESPISQLMSGHRTIAAQQ